MAVDGSGGTGGAGGGNPVLDAQDQIMGQYQQNAAANMQKEAEFSQMQAEASLGNTIAKANPSQ
ncbi:hypothetical protein [Bradyrhizobium sp. Tv2a-2]|uniref:hypothetical protein n=1 Tax=Bradyrhizobium sp. Tv2a-2 TaxID=113395 RepID=UPI0012EC999E|nr:hypothetical protein [Bradyrhizobium sp. Tv2a-2]